MKEPKYPPGVRFVFLLVLSCTMAFVLRIVTQSSEPREANLALAIVFAVLSLPVFLIAALPWANGKRLRTLFSASGLLLIAGAFLVLYFNRVRLDWHSLLPVLLLAGVMLFLTRPGPIPNDLRRPVGLFGQFILGVTVLLTIGLTLLIGLDRGRPDGLLVFLLFASQMIFGSLLICLGFGRKQRPLIKPLVSSGEAAIFFSFLLLAANTSGYSDRGMYYSITIGAAILFSLNVILRGMLGNWIRDLISGKPNPAASSVIPPVLGKTPPPSPQGVFIPNNIGFLALGGLAMLGVIGFFVGLLVSAMDEEASLSTAAMFSMMAVSAPYGFISSISFLIGLTVLITLIVRLQKYRFVAVGAALVLFASPFLTIAGYSVFEKVFAKAPPPKPEVVSEDYSEDYFEEPDFPPGHPMSMYGMEMEPPPEKTLAAGHDPAKLEGNYGLKKIHLAVLRGDLAETKAQQEAGIDLDTRDELGNTPLHLALGLGETAIAEWLIDQGASLQAKADDGRTLAHAAAAGGQLELLKNLNGKGLKLDTKTALGQVPLHFAAAVGQAETVDWLLGQGQSLTAKDAQENTPLHLAVLHGRAGLAKRLVEAGADSKAFNQDGQAAIHLACATGQLGLVHWLLRQDATLTNLPDADRFTPLYHAAINGQRHTSAMLISREGRINAGGDAELSILFEKILIDKTEYFERFRPQPEPFGGMGMGMPGMMAGYGMMPGMMPGYGMPPVPDFEEEDDSFLTDLIGVDEDGDGWDAFDEVITDHVDQDPEDHPTQEEVDAAITKFEELGWSEFKGSLTKNAEIVNAEPDEEAPSAPPGMPSVGNPYGTPPGMGMPPGMMGGARPPKKPEPKPEERKALAKRDAKGNSLLHYAAATGSEPLVSTLLELEEVPSHEKNQLGLTPEALADSLGRRAVVETFTPAFDMGMSMYGGYGMMPGMMPGMGMGMMPGMGMTNDTYEIPLTRPPAQALLANLWLTEFSPELIEEFQSWEEETMREFAESEEEAHSIADDLIGIDEDEDGMDAYDESITGHSDNDPDDTPTPEEVDAMLVLWDQDMDQDGWSALDEKLTGHSDNDASDAPTMEELNAYFESQIGSVSGLPMYQPGDFEIPGSSPGEQSINTVSQGFFQDELNLREATEKRIVAANKPQTFVSFHEWPLAGQMKKSRRHAITGLFQQSTDPRTGFSAIKWMELLNRHDHTAALAELSPADGALKRHQFRTTKDDATADGSLLHEFLQSDSEFALAFALDNLPDINQGDSRGRTALHVAAANGRLPAVKQMIEQGADIALVDDYGFTALHWAAQNGHQEVARHLVEVVELRPRPDRFQRTPAALAKANGHKTLSQYLQNR